MTIVSENMNVNSSSSMVSHIQGLTINKEISLKIVFDSYCRLVVQKF